MFRRAVRAAVATAVMFAVVAGGAASPAAAQEEECNGGCVVDPGTEPVVVNEPAFTGAPSANEEAISGVRKAFLRAKKKFHEGREEIQNVEKGDREPVDVPTFFDDSEDDDTSEGDG